MVDTLSLTALDSAAKTWSAQQEDIFLWFAASTVHGTTVRNLVVRARAGTGKTTTIVEATKHAPEQTILVCAFNKRIADELTVRLAKANPKAVAKTLHSIGFNCVMKFWSGVQVDKPRPGVPSRADMLTEQVCGPTAPDTIKKLVSKLHTKGREIAPHARKLGDLTDTMITFECVPDESWEGSRFDGAYVEQKALEAMELAANVKPRAIDFADMIFLPVRNRWMMKAYDLVIVDEAQDMTLAQLELAQGVCRGRFCVVGDDRQAIYAFRGADSESLDRLKKELNAAELGLTTTYRCGKAIVQLAATLVPDFVAGDRNPDGIIEQIFADKLVPSVAHGDFVLSRTNAPLVATAMSLLRNGKRARIAGRDIGAGLKALIRRFAKGSAAHSVPMLLARIAAWEEKEVARYTKAKRDDKIDAVRDQAETLVALTEGAASVREVESRIDGLFTDDGLGQAGVVTCSSVHRAKGLEADRVFIIANTLRSHTTEELNIQYVAITRAKSTLVWVHPALAV